MKPKSNDLDLRSGTKSAKITPKFGRNKKPNDFKNKIHFIDVRSDEGYFDGRDVSTSHANSGHDPTLWGPRSPLIPVVRSSIGPS